MIRDLGQQRQGLDLRDTATHEAEVEAGDREPCECPGTRSADAGAVEHDRPEERDAQVEGDGPSQEQNGAPFVRQEERARGARGLQGIATRRERVRRRGDAA